MKEAGFNHFSTMSRPPPPSLADGTTLPIIKNDAAIELKPHERERERCTDARASEWSAVLEHRGVLSSAGTTDMNSENRNKETPPELCRCRRTRNFDRGFISGQLGHRRGHRVQWRDASIERQGFALHQSSCLGCISSRNLPQYTSLILCLFPSSRNLQHAQVRARIYRIWSTCWCSASFAEVRQREGIWAGGLRVAASAQRVRRVRAPMSGSMAWECVRISHLDLIPGGGHSFFHPTRQDPADVSAYGVVLLA